MTEEKEVRKCFKCDEKKEDVEYYYSIEENLCEGCKDMIMANDTTGYCSLVCCYMGSCDDSC